MSWQAYVDSSLVGTGDVDKGAIFNSEGTSVWAATPGFSVQPAELKEVVAAFKEPGDVKTIQGTGFHIAGEKYITLRVIENRSIYGKKGKTGVVIVKTKQALIIGHYPETVQPGSCTQTVEKLADYLVSMGY